MDRGARGDIVRGVVVREGCREGRRGLGGAGGMGVGRWRAIERKGTGLLRQRLTKRGSCKVNRRHRHLDDMIGGSCELLTQRRSPTLKSLSNSTRDRAGQGAGLIHPITASVNLDAWSARANWGEQQSKEQRTVSDNNRRKFEE